MHGTSHLLIELGAVITALGLLAALSARVGISPIPLYLLAGLAFGKGGILPLATSKEFISTGRRDRRGAAALHARPGVHRERAHRRVAAVRSGRAHRPAGQRRAGGGMRAAARLGAGRRRGAG